MLLNFPQYFTFSLFWLSMQSRKDFQGSSIDISTTEEVAEPPKSLNVSTISPLRAIFRTENNYTL